MIYLYVDFAQRIFKSSQTRISVIKLVYICNSPLIYIFIRDFSLFITDQLVNERDFFLSLKVKNSLFTEDEISRDRSSTYLDKRFERADI